MSHLINWKPNLNKNDRSRNLRSQVDALFRDLYREDGHMPTFVPPVDLRETSEGFDVRVELPGVHLKDIDMEYLDGLLLIKGRKTTPLDEKADAEVGIYRESRGGEFDRRVAIQSPINEDNIVAKLESGILMVHLPKAEEAKPKKVDIQEKV